MNQNSEATKLDGRKSFEIGLSLALALLPQDPLNYAPGIVDPDAIKKMELHISWSGSRVRFKSCEPSSGNPGGVMGTEQLFYTMITLRGGEGAL